MVATVALALGWTGAARAATFQVDYIDVEGEGFKDQTPVGSTTLGARRKSAFSSSLSYWARALGSSPVAIRVEAKFANLGTGSSSVTLAQAGPKGFYILNSGSSTHPRFQPDTVYGAALANHLVGSDIDTLPNSGPSQAEITTTFNSQIDTENALGTRGFYYGVDGKNGSDIDFYTIALHEVGHGLNFLGFVDSTGAFGTSNGVVGTVPGIYDRFLTLGNSTSRTRITAMTQSQRASAVISNNLFFDGARAQVANGSMPAKIHAPNPYESGSSVSHLDEPTYSLPDPNELMTPRASGVAHDAGPVGLGVFYDMGWNIVPFVSSIRRLDASPINASQVRFLVTFTAPVREVNSIDFTVTKTGSLGTATVERVTGSGTTYIVTVNTGRNTNAASGTIRLNLVDNGSIVDAQGLQLGGAGGTGSVGDGGFNTGDVYIIGSSGSLVALVAVNGGTTRVARNVVGVDISSEPAIQSVISSSPILTNSSAVARASDGTLYVANFSTPHTIVKIAPDGTASALTSGASLLSQPRDIVIGPDGSLYVASAGNNTIVRVNASSGAQTLVSSNGGSDGSLLNSPRGLAFGTDGKLYVGNLNGHNILRITLATGLQEEYVSSSLLDAAGPSLCNPWGIAFSPSGTLYVNDNANERIVAVAPNAASVSRVTTTSSLTNLQGLAFGDDGNLYAAESDTNSIIRVAPASGATEVVTTGGSLVAVSDVAVAEVPLPTVSISGNGPAQVLEGDSASPSARFTVTLSGPSAQTVNVRVSTANITAVAPSDYGALQAGFSVSFAPGETSEIVSIPINDDALVEPTESFSVNLSLPQNALLGTASATGVILSDDAPAVATSGAIISEFRFRGTNGSKDEYVEIYNTTNGLLNISGWSIRYSNSSGGLTIASVPDNTVLPARGHFLFSGASFSLGNIAEGDAPLHVNAAGAVDATVDALDDGGVELRNAQDIARDAVGFGNSNFIESQALLSAPTQDGQYAFVLRQESGFPQDGNNNRNDFIFVSTYAGPTPSTAGTFAGTNGNVVSTQGAPGPENLASPVQRVNTLKIALVSGTDAMAEPNRLRLPLDVTAGTAPFGTLILRRKVTNNTPFPLTKMRFRAVRVTTRNSTPAGQTSVPAGQADVRLLSSGGETITIGGSSVQVLGTTLEAPSPLAQAAGGGVNSSLVEGNVLLAEPLAPGASRFYNFRLGVVTRGTFNVTLVLEASPAP